MGIQNLFIFIATVMTLIVPAIATAQTATFSYHGRVFNQRTGEPVSGAANVRLSISSDDFQCIVYDEIHTNIQLTQLGVFSLEVGKAQFQGAPNVTLANQDLGLSLSEIFSGVKNSRLNGRCQGDLTAMHPKYLHVSISTANGLSLILPPQAILSAPVASVANTLNGYTEDNFIHVNNIVTQQAVEDIILSGGKVGPQGPQGVQGPKGDTGARGAVGAKGDKGDRGVQGPQGVAGPQGPKGDTGAKGDKGVAGAKGDKGDRGAQGVQGPKGATGPQGPRGVAGAQGPQGPRGATGPQGPKGEKGDTGARGAIGPRGATGLGFVPGQMPCIINRKIKTGNDRKFGMDSVYNYSDRMELYLHNQTVESYVISGVVHHPQTHSIHTVYKNTYRCENRILKKIASVRIGKAAKPGRKDD